MIAIQVSRTGEERVAARRAAGKNKTPCGGAPRLPARGNAAGKRAAKKGRTTAGRL